MTMNKSEKTFDAVKMMREIREKLSEKYWKHPEVLKKDLEAIRKNTILKLLHPQVKPERMNLNPKYTSH
jgi:hypothetical protein